MIRSFYTKSRDGKCSVRGLGTRDVSIDRDLSPLGGKKYVHDLSIHRDLCVVWKFAANKKTPYAKSIEIAQGVGATVFPAAAIKDAPVDRTLCISGRLSLSTRNFRKHLIRFLFGIGSLPVLGKIERSKPIAHPPPCSKSALFKVDTPGSWTGGQGWISPVGYMPPWSFQVVVQEKHSTNLRRRKVSLAFIFFCLPLPPSSPSVKVCIIRDIPIYIYSMQTPQ